MKKKLLLFLGIVFSTSLYSQSQDWLLTSKLNIGCPKEIELIKKQLSLSEMNYTLLETGIDSVKLYFGQMTKSEVRGYWITVYLNNKLKSFSTVQLEKESLSKEVKIEFDHSRVISLFLSHDTKENEINYYWLSDNQKSKKLIFENIEKPIAVDKQFPNLKLQSLSGKEFEINDFKNKIVVINWWATGCAPCRQEIPGLNKLVEKYEFDSNILFLAIAHDKKDWLKNS